MITGVSATERIRRHTSIPGQPGQHHVEQHDLGFEGLEHSQGLLAVGGDIDYEPLGPQRHLQSLPIRGLVVDYQYPDSSAHLCQSAPPAERALILAAKSP